MQHAMPQGNARPSGRARDMALGIVGAGFGRTGTRSLQEAIEILGFGPCHHMYKVRNSARQLALWQAIADGALPDWDTVFEGFQSQVDWPASAHWKSIAEHFPDAKVILSVRDPEAWYESMLQTIVPSATIGTEVDPDPAGRAGSEIIRKVVLEQIFQGRIMDRAFALDRFARHREEVVDTIPADRLLTFDVREGWGPLCAFLGCAVPDQPFPSGNSVAEFRARKTYLSSPSP